MSEHQTTSVRSPCVPKVVANHAACRCAPIGHPASPEHVQNDESSLAFATLLPPEASFPTSPTPEHVGLAAPPRPFSDPFPNIAPTLPCAAWCKMRTPSYTNDKNPPAIQQMSTQSKMEPTSYPAFRLPALTVRTDQSTLCPPFPLAALQAAQHTRESRSPPDRRPINQLATIPRVNATACRVVSSFCPSLRLPQCAVAVAMLETRAHPSGPRLLATPSTNSPLLRRPRFRSALNETPPPLPAVLPARNSSPLQCTAKSLALTHRLYYLTHKSRVTLSDHCCVLWPLITGGGGGGRGGAGALEEARHWSTGYKLGGRSSGRGGGVHRALPGEQGVAARCSPLRQFNDVPRSIVTDSLLISYNVMVCI